MENTKKRLDNRRCPPVNKEADILDQLKCCDIYLDHIADSTGVAGNTSQLYDTLRVSACHCDWK